MRGCVKTMKIRHVRNGTVIERRKVATPTKKTFQTKQISNDFFHKLRRKRYG